MSKPTAYFVDLLLAGIGGGVIALILTAAQGALIPRADAAGADVVRAQAFEVMGGGGDGTSRVRARLDADGLMLFDSAGNGRAGLVLLDDGTVTLSLLDPAGRVRAILASDGAGEPHLNLRDAAGVTRMMLAGPMLSVNDGAGVTRLAAGVVDGVGAGVTLSDGNGTVRAGLRDDGVVTYDATGTKRRPK